MIADESVRILLELRDGRVTRDPARVTPEGGELLETRWIERPIDLGERLTLASGDEVLIIGFNETIKHDEWKIVAHVGEPWADELRKGPAW